MVGSHAKVRYSVPLFITTVLGTVGLGMLSGLFSGSKAGYSGLVVPAATPPDWVFPVVWSVLYVMIGLSLFFILRKPATTELLAARKKVSYILWAVQFAMMLCWPFAFFTLKLYTFSLVWMALMLSVTLALIISSFFVSPTAAALLIPYELWLSFAFYLSIFIAILN